MPNKEHALENYKLTLACSDFFQWLTADEQTEVITKLNTANLKGSYKSRWNQCCRIFYDFCMKV